MDGSPKKASPHQQARPPPSWSGINTHFAGKLESGGSSGGVGFGIGSYGRHGGIAIGTGNQVREYDEGSLTIDLVDADSAALLWRGTGTQRFREYKDPEKASRDINTLVEKIIAQFPPHEVKGLRGNKT
jgi:hypothetical protein